MKIGACISQHTALHSASLHCWLMVYAFMNPFGWLSSELLTTIEMQIGIFIKCACDVLSRLILVQSPLTVKWSRLESLPWSRRRIFCSWNLFFALIGIIQRVQEIKMKPFSRSTWFFDEANGNISWVERYFAATRQQICIHEKWTSGRALSWWWGRQSVGQKLSIDRTCLRSLLSDVSAAATATMTMLLRFACTSDIFVHCLRT